MNHRLVGMTLLLLSPWGCDSRGDRSLGAADPGPTNPAPVDPIPADPTPSNPAPSNPGPANLPAYLITISPRSAPRGSADLSLSIMGKDFADPGACLSCKRSVVVWVGNGGRTPLQATFVSSTQLTAAVPAALMTDVVTARVFVETWAGQEDAPRSTSGDAFFTVFPGTPAIRSISPVSVPAGSSWVWLNITGSGFEDEGVLTSGVAWATEPTGQSEPKRLQTYFVNESTVYAVIPAELLRTPITARVFVMTWDRDAWSEAANIPRSNAISFVVTP